MGKKRGGGQLRGRGTGWAFAFFASAPGAPLLPFRRAASKHVVQQHGHDRVAGRHVPVNNKLGRVAFADQQLVDRAAANAEVWPLGPL